MAGNLPSYIYKDEKTLVEELLQGLSWDESKSARIEKNAAALVEKVRSSKRKMGELESFFQQYGLNSEEGLALMTLAEALLRIPDPATANALIRDKMVAADWLSKQGETKDLLVKAAGFGLSLTRKTLDSVASRLGEPVIRKAMVEAMRLLGRQFVLGQTIEDAIKNGREYQKKGYRLSYDMLGEAARTAEDAEKFFESYSHAIRVVGENTKDAKSPHSISVKLSALYPRYHYSHAADCVPVMIEKLRALSLQAANSNISLTVDAEEVDRLEMSLQIFAAVANDPALKDWPRLGLAVQAYQKRAPAVLDYLEDLAKETGRKINVRLVKGAYWDTEIKRAQVMGLPDYPVYSRKVNTDLSYLYCAQKLMDGRDYFYPMMATHNAHTMTAVLDMAGNDLSGFEFQRLHGMGETIHDVIMKNNDVQGCVYAPCGTHEELLPYLVRRLLENGANSSFVNKLLDPSIPAADIVADPVLDAQKHQERRHPHIPLPADIYGAGRRNSKGLDLTEEMVVTPLLKEMAAVDDREYEALPVIGGKNEAGKDWHDVKNPADTDQVVGRVCYADGQMIDKAFESAAEGFEIWHKTPANERAQALLNLADLMEENMAELMGLCVREAGKTIADALAEVREAVDFCRFYAQQGASLFDEKGTVLPGPTGESNVLTLYGRGIFVCISPWNFPLAIFTGQITAALMAGNAVISKPAEQTSLIGHYMTRLIHKAGVPEAAFNILPGDGKTGAALVAHPDVAGVAFTGSTEAAHSINRTLAGKDGPIIPLIAETGGQNAMIVDSSALTEQIIDDVLISAFGAAGQRCSALRVLYVQDDVADRVIHMLKGAMAEQTVGDPMCLASDIGPVIDQEALQTLRDHRKNLDQMGRFIAEIPVPDNIVHGGHFFAPVAYEINDIEQLGREVFGPVLHVVRYDAADIGKVMDGINKTGYGLTFGVHSRIGSFVNNVTGQARVGNAYVNRTMIGAVVGVQPFGGNGLSGTGPKAGGPHYLPRFANEKVVSIDTTRQGGNASLVSLEE